ncbi:protein eva-1 homolog A isoform X4 [Neopsephotus bourkii]|uniref:protein eva-1 homolog A isoform X4 n=1 Tax=Neopsephotus bourkii TaxID=309878 RepID=UPI002AA50726|nr:protein eva-1 homolog A isoform X4 [Neopsephotus bourkii]
MSGAKFGLEPGEVSVSFPVAALLDTRSRALLRSPLLSSRRRTGRPPSRLAAFGEDVSGQGHTSRSRLSHRIPTLALPTGSAPSLLLTTPEKPNEKKKGRSATFYPLDNSPFLLPVDETQLPALNSSMEPVGVSTEMALLSNILAAYAFITENPERAALYFVSGVCIGLVLTLLALVLRVSCRTDCKRSSTKKPPRERESDSDSSDSDDDSDTTSDLSARRHRRFERTLNMNVFTSAEELERAQRLEERERIIREIWMNGQPDIPGTRSLNRYY